VPQEGKELGGDLIEWFHIRRVRAPVHCQYRARGDSREYRPHPISAGIAPHGAVLRIRGPDERVEMHGRFISIPLPS
jgi:hypothetical protein